MLQESRLYSFIDQKEGFTLHFLEGQKLIHDVALTHPIVGEGFRFYRDILLSTQMLLAFLKSDEGLGIYLDSETPYFKYKIEMSDSGQMRALLIPDEFKEFPKKITGKCRLAKITPEEKQPYVSIIDLDNTDLEQVINKILKDSYQLKSEVFLSPTSDQAILISKLPSIDINRIQTNYTLSVHEYWTKNERHFQEIFENFEASYEMIQAHFEKINLTLLSSRQVLFKCTCSRERIMNGLWSLIKTSGIDHVFMPDENEIQTKCDYCSTNYTISKSEFLN
jgi:molecular chaperone Hsp33